MSEGTLFLLCLTQGLLGGAIFCVSSEDNSGFSASPMAIASKTAFSEPTFSVNDCVHSVVSKPGVTKPRTINLWNKNVRDVFSSALVPTGRARNLTETVFSDNILPSTPSPKSNVRPVTQLAVQLDP